MIPFLFSVIPTTAAGLVFGFGRYGGFEGLPANLFGFGAHGCGRFRFSRHRVKPFLNSACVRFAHAIQ
jgi:hypothetical protein